MRFIYQVLTFVLAFAFASCGPAFASFLVPEGSITQAKLHASVQDQAGILNCSIAASVGSSALTITLKDGGGYALSTSSPCKIAFRSATASSGNFAQFTRTSAQTLVISSGSTMGHVGGFTGSEYIYVYALNNSGTIELAASSKLYDEGSIVTTTAEGGAGAADSKTVIYSATARTDKAIRLIARLGSLQPVAGTWSAVPVEISAAPFQLQPPALRAWVHFDGITDNDLNGTYARVGTTVTVTATAHGQKVGHIVVANFTSGTAVDGDFVVTSVADANTFTFTHGTSGSTSGNITLERVTVLAAYNVDNVSQTGAGNYMVNFSTPMPDTNYAIQVNPSRPTAASATYTGHMQNDFTPSYSTMSVIITTGATNISVNYTLTDLAHVLATVYR